MLLILDLHSKNYILNSREIRDFDPQLHPPSPLIREKHIYSEFQLHIFVLNFKRDTAFSFIKKKIAIC